MKRLENVTLIGMGALGTLFATILLESLPPESVTFLMDPERYEKYHAEPVLVNGTPVCFNMVTPEPSCSSGHPGNLRRPRYDHHLCH